MANVGFDTSELDTYMRDMAGLSRTMPKECKKFLKKSATDLSKVQKSTFKSFGIGDTGETEKEILKSIKSGKTYKYAGEMHCRAYCSHPLGHLFDVGFIHKGGFKDKIGAETWVEGYHFIEKAEQQFQGGYARSIDDFIDKMIREM
ncbi:HK97 gp10 family phage protein [Clostridium sp. CF012]|uniref:HK97 gp10 family phage protein n=1 Tax=Clostridium sp. CF012 TaxID=2843319 RepID=UPI001C0B5464|nr:HK97 gp10 family phage protein [Clostridium sp. CF012]MBU3145728.1 HK97 gp10 family phage protein [Clostridium sp. CF012]